MGLLDSVTSAGRAVSLFGGRDLGDESTAFLCGGLAFPLAWACAEFAYSFPFNRKAPLRLRVPLVLWLTLGLTLHFARFKNLHPGWQGLYVFFPVFVVTVILLL